jgi:hypothetical protein
MKGIYYQLTEFGKSRIDEMDLYFFMIDPVDSAVIISFKDSPKTINQVKNEIQWGSKDKWGRIIKGRGSYDVVKNRVDFYIGRGILSKSQTFMQETDKNIKEEINNTAQKNPFMPKDKQ